MFNNQIEIKPFDQYTRKGLSRVLQHDLGRCRLEVKKVDHRSGEADRRAYERRNDGHGRRAEERPDRAEHHDERDGVQAEVEREQLRLELAEQLPREVLVPAGKSVARERHEGWAS